MAVAALLGAGCGGSDSAPVVPVQGASGASGAQGVAALSKPQYTKQVDAVCGEANAALAGLESATVGNDVEVRVAQELQVVRSELESIQALKPPTEDRSTLNDFLSALSDQVDALAAKRTALDQGGDASAAESELADAEARAQSAAGDYGLKDCSGGAVPPSTTTEQTTTTTLAAPPPTTATPTAPTAAAPPVTGAPTGGAPTGGAPTGGGTSGGGATGGTAGGGGTGGVSP